MTTTIPAFRLDLHSTNGPVLLGLSEDDSDIRVHEWTTWLRIRSDVTGFVAPAAAVDDDEFTSFVPPVFEHDGLAMLVVTRPQQDFSGQSIGVFSGRLDSDELARLQAMVEGIRWADLPRPVGGDFTAPNLKIRYERGDLLIERGFNARSTNFLTAIGPLMGVLEGCLSRVRKGALGTLEVKLSIVADPDSPARKTLRVRLQNRGIESVVLTDPRVARAEGEPPRPEIRVGELPAGIPGVDPREWTTLPLPPLPEGAPRTLVIRPGRSTEFALAYTAPKPGSYLVRVKWEDYAGPLDPVTGQIPFMPLPRQGPSYLGSGPYAVRGATFAAHQFVVEAQSP